MSSRTATALALSAGLLLAGCNEDTTSSDALDAASIKLSALAPRGQRAPSPAYQEQTFKSILATLQPVATKGNKSQVAAAAVLMAQAHAGLAEIPAARSASLERDCIHRASAIRAALSQWHTFSAMGAGAAKFDPAPQFADLDKSEREIDALIGSEMARKSKVEAEVTRLQQAAAAKADQARRRQAEAGQLKQRVPNETATVGEQILIQAAAMSREADKLEVEAARFEAEAAKISPQIGEVQISLDRLARQKQLVAASRDDLRKRDQAAKAQAADSRAAAKKAADELQSEIDKLTTLRTKDLAASDDEAIAALETAATTAKRAIQQDRVSAQLAVGSARQSLGDVQWTRGQGLRDHATLLESLAQAGVPNSEALKTEAAKSREGAATAFAAAVEAYKEAHEAYQASGATGDGKERLERVSRILDKAVRAASDGKMDLGLSESAPAPEAEATSETPAAPGEIVADQSTPQGVLQILFDIAKSKDYSRLGEVFAFSNDLEKQSFASLNALRPMAEKLDEALKAKFGKGMDDMPGANAGFDLDAYKNLKASDIPVTITGDTAEATLPNGTLLLKQTDGKWAVDLRSMGADPQQIAMAGLMVPTFSKTLDEMTADVNAGKFSTYEQAMQALMAKMASGMPGMPRPGGG
ncbi:MAG: hypothetical protein ACKVW3_15110 [Phycisphaerales bacterium]